jgi:peptide/nickel transport system substrate-binding protein
LKSRKIFVAPLLAGALVLGACGGSGSDDGTGSSDEPSIAPISSVDVNAVDRGTLQQGGEIKLSVSDFGTNWNPMHIDGNNNELTSVRNPLFPTLFNFDVKGVPTPNPDFLTSATVTKEAPTTVDFKFNPKAVWGDGSPLGAADLTAMWKACSGENKKFNCASTDGYDSIASVKQGASASEATVTYKTAFPDWSQPFTSLVKAASIKDPETFNNGWTSLKNEWLSGPFKVASFDKTQKVLIEVPNDKWWGNKPLLDKITWRQISADAAAAAYANGEIDSFDIGPDPDGYAKAKGVTGGAIRQAAGPNWRHITFNSKAGLLQDPVIRKAIVEGLDRTAIGASDLAGIDWPVRPLNNNIILENQDGYVDIAKETGIDYNVEKAKSDLEAAGWVAGADGIREKGGKKLEVKFSQLTGVPVSQNEALQTQNMLKEIGVKVTLVNVASDKFNTVLSGHQFEMIAFTWIGTPYPFANINQLYGTGSESNYAQLSMPEVDTLTKQIKSETDKAKRVDLANQTAKVIWENVHTLPLYQRPELIAVKSNLANYGAFGLTNVLWENVGYQK